MKRLIALAVALLLAVAAQASVNLNTADVPAIMVLKGVSKINARNIVNDREINGPFENFVDIDKRVKGIGKKQIKALKAAGARVGAYDEYDAYASNAK